MAWRSTGRSITQVVRARRQWSIAIAQVAGTRCGSGAAVSAAPASIDVAALPRGLDDATRGGTAGAQVEDLAEARDDAGLGPGLDNGLKLAGALRPRPGAIVGNEAGAMQKTGVRQGGVLVRTSP
jgi:hypothetical protein